MQHLNDHKNAVTSKAPIAWDLFAGCGGLTAGLKDAGFRVTGAVELDERARGTYASNHPEVALVGQDIRQADPVQLMKDAGLAEGDLDLLAGCPPCQGFSRIRKRNAKRSSRDDRNALIEDFGRFVQALRPKLVMMENVPGLVAHHRFGKLVTQLKKLEYTVRYEVLDVADFGVAQRRQRLILVGSRNGTAELAEPSSKRRTVRQTIGALPVPGAGRDALHNIPEARSARVRAVIAAIPTDGGSRGDLPQRMQLECHRNTKGFHDVFGRMAWDKVSPTITGGCHNPSKGRFLHPDQNRNITLREAAMLQGFPKSYRFHVEHGKEAIALMIGNALPPPFIAAHAKAIRRSLPTP